MYTNSKIIFDLENPLFSVVNLNREFIKNGLLDNAFNFRSGLFVTPVIDSIINRLQKIGVADTSPTIVVSKSNEKYVKALHHFQLIIAKEPIGNWAGNQTADFGVKHVLCHLFKTTPIDTLIVLISGDGGFVNDLLKLKNKGHKVLVVSPGWCINRSYYNELGLCEVLTLELDWFLEVIQLTIKSLPHAE